MIKKVISAEFHLNLDENQDSMQFLVHANSQSEWMWSFYLNYVMIGGGISLFVSAIVSVLVGKLIDDQYVTEYSHRPFVSM